MKSTLSFFFCCLWLCCYLHEITVKPNCYTDFPQCFYSKNFIIFAPKLRSPINFYLTFVYSIKSEPTSSLCMQTSSSPTTTCWKDFPFPTGLGFLVKNHLTIYMSFILVFSSLSHWAIYVCPMPILYCLNYCSSIEGSGGVNPPFCSSFPILFGYLWPTAIPYEFEDQLYHFSEKGFWCFGRDCTESTDGTEFVDLNSATSSYP